MEVESPGPGNGFLSEIRSKASLEGPVGIRQAKVNTEAAVAGD